MTEKKYVITEKEIKDVFYMGIDGEDFSFDDFIKFKQPVELLAKGGVIKEDEEGMYIDGDLLDWKIGKFYQNKRVKLYIEVVK